MTPAAASAARASAAPSPRIARGDAVPASATAAPRRAPSAPRRISGPARPRRAPSPSPLDERLGRLVDHPLLDRLIRGRAWIALITFALIGIVAMEVVLLRLNTTIGRSIEHATTLERQNAILGTQVSQLAAADRIVAAAAARGMVYASASDVRFLHPGAGDAARAASSIEPPAAAAGLASQGPTGPIGSGGASGVASPSATATSAAGSGAASGSGQTRQAGGPAPVVPAAAGPAQPASQAAGTTATPATSSAGGGSAAPGG